MQKFNNNKVLKYKILGATEHGKMELLPKVVRPTDIHLVYIIMMAMLSFYVWYYSKGWKWSI